jgi:hypothetical protein
MLESPPYRVLSLAAHRVLSRLEIELAHHGGNDNGSLPCTFDDFEQYGIHRHAIAPAIRELAALGFIEVTDAGRAGTGGYGKPQKFRLTFRNTSINDATNEWRKITTIDAAEMIAAAARKPRSTNSRALRPKGELHKQLQ